MYSIFWHDAWKVLLYSMVLGAGLPVVYALGVRSLALGTTTPADEAQAESPHALGVVLAAMCMLVVAAGVGVGLAFIIATGHGEQLSFAHGYPTFVPKS